MQRYTALATAVNHPDAINPYYGIFNYRILRSLSRAGTALDVVSPRPFTPPVGPYSAYSSIPDTEDWGPYTVHHPRFWYLLPKRFFYGVSGDSYADRVPAYVEQTFETPDVIHACHLYPDGYGMLSYARKHDVPLFVVAHGTLLNTLGDHPRGVDDKIRQTLSEADSVLCVSEALTAKAQRFTDPSKVETVPIGADPDTFPVERERHIRRELDIPSEATVVLFVGAFTESKGVAEICAALPELDRSRVDTSPATHSNSVTATDNDSAATTNRDSETTTNRDSETTTYGDSETSDTVFVFVGRDGELEEDLRQTVVESGFSDRYVYAGLPPLALRRWYAVADLLLLPSHSEGRPTVIYEAMASETAVLASDVDGIPEQVADGETGVLIPPGDVAALVDALDSLTEDRNRLNRMGKAGYERLLDKRWTWRDHADRVQELHREAL